MLRWSPLAALLAGCYAFGGTSDAASRSVDAATSDAGSVLADGGAAVDVGDATSSNPVCARPNGAYIFDDFDAPDPGQGATFTNGSGHTFTFDPMIELCGSASLHLDSTGIAVVSRAIRTSSAPVQSFSWSFLYYLASVTPSNIDVTFASVGLFNTTLGFAFANGQIDVNGGTLTGVSAGPVALGRWQTLEVDVTYPAGASAMLTVRAGDPTNPATVISNRALGNVGPPQSESLGLVSDPGGAKIDIRFDRDAWTVTPL